MNQNINNINEENNTQTEKEKEDDRKRIQEKVEKIINATPEYAIQNDKPKSPMTYTLLIVNVLIYFAMASLSKDTSLNTQLLVNFGAYTQNSSIYTSLTYLFLHASFIHIFFNSGALLVYGKPVEYVFGKYFLLIYFLSGILSGISAINLAGTEVLVGASGSICGLLGAFYIYILKSETNGLSKKRKILSYDLIILLLFSFLPNVSLTAHLIGFITGAIIAYILIHQNKVLVLKVVYDDEK